MKAATITGTEQKETKGKKGKKIDKRHRGSHGGLKKYSIGGGSGTK
jgi:hypothetical protein